MSLNRPQMTLNGNLTGDPEHHYTHAGQLAVEFTVAVNPRYRDSSGEWREEEPQFWRVKVWGPAGENLMNTLRRGQNVTVVGSVRAYTWTDKDTGKKRRGYEIIPDDVAISLKFQTGTFGRILGAPQPSETPAEPQQPPAEGGSGEQ